MSKKPSKVKKWCVYSGKRLVSCHRTNRAAVHKVLHNNVGWVIKAIT